MKLLFVHDYPHKEGGGVETQTHQDALELSARGFQVTIATPRLTSETKHQDTETYPQKIGNLTLEHIHSEKYLEELIQATDIVHIQTTFSLRDGQMSTLRLCEKLKKPYVVSLCTTINHIPYSALATLSQATQLEKLTQFREYLSSNLCTIVCTSRALKESVDSLTIKKPLVYIYYGKDWEKLPTVNPDRKIDFDITFVGELSVMKGVFVLLEAFRLVLEKRPETTLRLIGNGQDKNKIEKYIQAHMLDSRIVVDKYIDNKYITREMSRSKMIVVPSLTEAWGIVAMEATGLGIPTVVSACEGLIELSDNGRRALLATPNNAEDLSVKIFSLLDNKEIYEYYARPEIANEIRETYSLGNRMDGLTKLYESIFFLMGSNASRRVEDMLLHERLADQAIS